MDRDEVWRTIDQQRAELADLMETFTDADWETPSLCEGWRVREVGRTSPWPRPGCWRRWARPSAHAGASTG